MINRRHLLAAGAAALAVRPGHAAALDTLVERAGTFDQLHSLTLLVDGRAVLSERFRGPALDAAVNIKSVSKSIVALLAGIAIDRGDLPGVTATIGQVAPRLIPSDADPRVADITVENLVTLRAGLERTSGGNYGAWVSSRNWVADALSRPIVAEPGTRMLYSTGSTHVLGAVLAEATGLSLLEQARQRLGAPLGIDIPGWERDPQGYYLGGNQMALTPAAMARVGEMVRLGGAWNGTQVVSRDWLDASLIRRTRSAWSGLGYGYGWFLGRHAGADYALARGYGGQIIAVVPDRALTLAMTSDPTRPARSGGYFSDLRGLIESAIDGVTQA